MFVSRQSLPRWGRCRTYVRRMRCSPFSRYKIWTPHPPLSWSPFSRWRRLAKIAETSRRGGLFAHKSTVGATIGRPKTNGDCSEKAGDQWSPLQTKLKISRRCGLFAQNIVCRDRASAVAKQQDCPKTSDYLNENGGRGNPSPTTKKPKPRGVAVCSRTPKPSPVGSKVASNRRVLQAKHRVPRNEADEVLNLFAV